MSNLSIVAARADDLEMLNDLMYELHHEHHSACPEHFKTAEDIEQEKSIARYLDSPECLVYVAKQNDSIIGFITGHFCELISTVSKPVPMGSIDELYVLSEFRKQGVATLLYKKLETTLIDYGVEQVFVEVWAFNQNAHRFYEDSGFEPHIAWLRKSVKHH